MSLEAGRDRTGCGRTGEQGITWAEADEEMLGGGTIGWETDNDESLINWHVTEMRWTGLGGGGVGRMAIAIAIMLASEAQRLRGKLRVRLTDFHYYNLRYRPNTNLTNLELPSSRVPTQPSSSSSSAPPSSPSLSSVPFPRSFCACGAMEQTKLHHHRPHAATMQQLNNSRARFPFQPSRQPQL